MGGHSVAADLFRYFQVGLRFREKLLGGVPRCEDDIRAWLSARGLSHLIDATLADVDLVTAEEWTWTGFKRDAGGLFVEARQVTAMIRECAATLSLIKEVRGLRQHLWHGLFVKPARLHLGVQEPGGTLEVVGQVQTARGPRSIRKKVDYVLGAQIDCELWALANGRLAEEHLRRVLALAQESGLGAMRTQGYGQFDLVEFRPAPESRYA